MNNDKKLTNAYMDLTNDVFVICKAKKDQSLSAIDQAINSVTLEKINKKLLTKEEAEQVAFYLRRDLHDMAQFLEEDEEAEPSDWLSFDLKLLESRIWETFLSIADKTRVELATFSQRLEYPSEYAAGEITGLGTLECSACGNCLHFYKAEVIPVCSECGSRNYMRVSD